MPSRWLFAIFLNLHIFPDQVEYIRDLVFSWVRRPAWMSLTSFSKRPYRVSFTMHVLSETENHVGGSDYPCNNKVCNWESDSRCQAYCCPLSTMVVSYWQPICPKYLFFFFFVNSRLKILYGLCIPTLGNFYAHCSELISNHYFFIYSAESVSVSRELVASIVACGFLCLFPGRSADRNSNFSPINFDNYFCHLSQ